MAGQPLSAFLDAYRRYARPVAEVHAELVAKTRRWGCAGALLLGLAMQGGCAAGWGWTARTAAGCRLHSTTPPLLFSHPCPPGSKEAASFRIAAAVRGKRTVPCVLVIEPPTEEDAGGAPATTTRHLYRAGGWA